MSAPPGLHQLSRLHGIQTAYYDNDGRRISARTEALMATLRALGVEVEDAADIPSRLAYWRHELEARVVEPVVVVWIPEGAEEAAGRVTLRIPARLRRRPVRVRVALERGGERVASVDPDALTPATSSGDDERDIPTAAAVPLPRVPAGYHTLGVELGAGRSRRRYEALLIAAPTRAAGWDRLPGRVGGQPEEGDRGKPWGLFAPLYGLWDADTDRLPHYGLLGALAERASRAGASVVGTLPLLAAFLDRPYEPSPYAPVSRLFWNEVYVRPRSSPGTRPRDAGSASGDPADEDPAVRPFRAREAMTAVRPVLEAEARALWQEADASAAGSEAGPERRGLGLEAPRQMRSYVEAHPRAEDYARFRALTEAHGPWPKWGARLRARDIRPGDFDPAVARYHLYAQWRAHQQLAAATERAEAAGAGLYLDLPLGVHPAGYDTWRERSLFAHGTTVGAPPDPLARGGQDWGFPPLIPEQSRRQGHRYFIAAIRTHLRRASVLRIDHVMQLHRMFWIATGDARDGVYVRYPAAELYAILCLESHRADTVIVGEDLGTVPREVRRTMRRHGVPGMYVVQFELEEVEERGTEHGARGATGGSGAPGLVPKRVRPGSLASIGTHDTPTFAGWWWGDDVRVRRSLGQLSEEEAAAELAGRGEMRTKLLKGLGIGGVDRGGPSGERDQALRVEKELLRRLGESDAGLVLAAVEDLWLEREPQNVPGTASEANWNRRLDRSVKALADPAIAALLETLENARTESGEEKT